MDDPHRRTGPEELRRLVDSGLGVLCFEAQADGVPCTNPSTACMECARIRPSPDPSSENDLRVGTQG